MKSYDVFLDYYDEIVRGINSPLDEEVEFLDEIIKKHSPKAQRILETACGTGVVAKEFLKYGYDITGLDISPEMLKRAENHIPKEKLILWDMTNCDLWKKFDVVLCNYNSICHLLDWKSWQKFFEMSFTHLEDWGILVFDINTLFEFENITREFAQFYNFWEDSVCLEMFKKDGIYEWLIKIFKKSPDGRYDLIQEIVKENSFPIEKIKKELKNQKFQLLEMLDFHSWIVHSESERVYFIAKKK